MCWRGWRAWAVAGVRCPVAAPAQRRTVRHQNGTHRPGRPDESPESATTCGKRLNSPALLHGEHPKMVDSAPELRFTVPFALIPSSVAPVAGL
jgi:hypothetical protein